MVLADQPAELLLDNVELETVALGDDGLNVPNTGLPDGILWRDKVLSDEPDSLICIWHKLREVSPAVSISEVNARALREMLPPPTRLTLRHEVTQRRLVNARRVLGWQATKTLWGKSQYLRRSLDFIGVSIHGVASRLTSDWADRGWESTPSSKVGPDHGRQINRLLQQSQIGKHRHLFEAGASVFGRSCPLPMIDRLMHPSFASSSFSITANGIRRILGAAEVGDFLTHLAADRNVAPSTQRQAFR